MACKLAMLCCMPVFFFNRNTTSTPEGLYHEPATWVATERLISDQTVISPLLWFGEPCQVHGKHLENPI